MNTIRLTIAAILFAIAALITPDTPEGVELLVKIGTCAK